MSIAREYARTLRRHLRCRPVWPPMLDIVPGDYGVFRGGVFVRVGNVTTDFGVPVVVEPGGRRADKFQYHSDGAVALAADAALAGAGADAGLKIGLSRRSSFFVSIADLDVRRLQSPHAVAARLRELPQWPHLRYFVVSELYGGRDLLFYGTESGEAGVTVRGDTDELRLFQTNARIGGSIQFAATGDVSVQFRGSADVVAGFGLNLFRVKQIGDMPLVMSFGQGDAPPGNLIAVRDDDPLEELVHEDDDDPDDALA